MQKLTTKFSRYTLMSTSLVTLQQILLLYLTYTSTVPILFSDYQPEIEGCADKDLQNTRWNHEPFVTLLTPNRVFQQICGVISSDEY